MINIAAIKCICGHSKINHEEPTVNRHIICRPCWADWAHGRNDITEESLSHEFKQDNLKYLEQCLEDNNRW